MIPANFCFDLKKRRAAEKNSQNSNSEIFTTTKKLAVLLEKKRYKFIYGGRASGKTTFVADALVKLSLERRAKFLCCREIQKSLKGSNYESIKKAIIKEKLRSSFIFNNDKIICKQNGSSFIFQGLRSNADQILSLEDISYAWIEQAESISQDSLDILTPTIRSPGSEIWVTYNPRYPSDAIEILREKVKNYSLSVNINHYDNKHLPPEMEMEREICKEKSPENYGHIWLGEHKTENIERTVLPYKHLKLAVGAAKRLGYKGSNYGYAGLDVADGGADKPALAVRYGSELIFVKELKDKNGNEIANSVFIELINYRIARCHYDVTGVGASIKAEFYRRNKKYGGLPFTPSPYLFGGAIQGKRTMYMYPFTNADYFSRANAQGYWNLRLRLDNTIRLLNKESKNVDINRCLFLPENTSENLLRELSQIVYSFDASDKMKIDKQPIDKGSKSRKKSPNLADAVMMAFSHDIIHGLKAY